MNVMFDKEVVLPLEKGEPVNDIYGARAQLIYAESYYNKWLILVSHVDSYGNIQRHAAYNISERVMRVNRERTENWGNIAELEIYKYYYATREQKKCFTKFLSKGFGLKFVSTINRLIKR